MSHILVTSQAYSRYGVRIGIFVSLMLLFDPLAAFGQDAATKPSTPSTSPTIKTVTATQESIQSEVVLSGTFVALETHEITVSTKKAQSLIIAHIAAHGQQVQKGEVILRLDTTKIDEAIADQQSVAALSALALKEAEAQLQLAIEREPLNKEQTELTKRYEDEDFRRFQEVDQPFAKRAAEESLSMAKQGLEYSEEELKQLEQMYKADDLTEQTEEIILRRARNDVARAKFYFSQSENQYERSNKFTLPRTTQEKEAAHRLSQLTYKLSLVMQSVEVSKQRLAVDKSRLENQRATQALAELRQDRKRLVVKSPIRGVVYYGRANDGKWPAVAELSKRLAPHETITPRETILTIVDNQSLTFLAKVPEADLAKVQQGAAGRITPTAYPQERIAARLKQLESVPVADGQFRVTVDIESGSALKLVAGMTGTAKIVTYANAKAITVPSKVVFTDPSDDTKKFVYVVGSNEKGERRDCTVGVTMGDRIEVLSGLSLGEQVLEEKPAH